MLVSSVFDLSGLLAPFVVNMRRLPKVILTKNGNYCVKDVKRVSKENF